LRSGQSLSLAVMGPAPGGAVRVSASAVAKMSGETVVFVQTPKGAVMRKVALAEGGSGTQGERVVLSGLKPGEHVVISAVSELKALAAADCDQPCFEPLSPGRSPIGCSFWSSPVSWRAWAHGRS
jgi:cobalt-zinc-cadmium efflux system membrane fusion protein